jgi:hypothetical protein
MRLTCRVKRSSAVLVARSGRRGKRLTHSILEIDIGSSVQQEERNFQMTFEASSMEWHGIRLEESEPD